MMRLEVKKAKEMKELGIGLGEMSEEQRRKKYGRLMMYVSLTVLGLFMILLVVGIAAQKDGRSCGERQSLESAVCIDCEEKTCMDCDGNSKVCKQCEVGYVLTPDGKCMDCDDKTWVECSECSINPDGKTT